MKICYVVPGALRSRPGGEAEAASRAAYLRARARIATEIELVDDPDGPASIESAEEERRAAARIAGLVGGLKGCDAAIVGCFGDPGLEAAREAAAMPVIGPAGASFATACGHAPRFGILTVVDGVVPLLRELVHAHGCGERSAGIEAIDVPVLELGSRRSEVLDRLERHGRRLVRDSGAGALVLGCMTMGFLDLAARLQERVGVPVVDPALAALRAAEAAAS